MTKDELKQKAAALLRSGILFLEEREVDEFIAIMDKYEETDLKTGIEYLEAEIAERKKSVAEYNQMYEEDMKRIKNSKTAGQQDSQTAGV